MSHIFISHATADDAFVADLHRALEALKFPVWVDSRNLRGGAKLRPEIEQAVEAARQVIAVLSPQTVNSPWVRREINHALKVAKRRTEAKVKPLTWHDFRRSFAGNLLDNGQDLVTVQKLMGHASPVTTSNYDRRGEEAKRRASWSLHVPYTRRGLGLG